MITTSTKHSRARMLLHQRRYPPAICPGPKLVLVTMLSTNDQLVTGCPSYLQQYALVLIH